MPRVIALTLMAWLSFSICLSAEEKKTLGPISCTIPKGWVAMKGLETILRYTTPEGPSGIMLLVGSRPKGDATIQSLHKAFSNQFKHYRKELEKVVGKAMIGKRRFTKKDLVDPKVEIAQRNGTKVVHFTATWARSKGDEESQVLMTESFHFISGEQQYNLTLAGPMHLFETYEKDIKKIVDSLKITAQKEAKDK